MLQIFGLGGMSNRGESRWSGGLPPRKCLWNLASLRLILGTILMSIHMQLSPFGGMMHKFTINTDNFTKFLGGREGGGTGHWGGKTLCCIRYCDYNSKYLKKLYKSTRL